MSCWFGDLVGDGERETDRLHSAHAIAPCVRFHSRSLCLPEFAVSLRPEGGMGVEHSLSLKQWTPKPRKYRREAEGEVQTGVIAQKT